MKLDRVTFTPVAVLFVTPEEIDALIQCAAEHYDAACRSAGEVGGFLYGMKMRSTTVVTGDSFLMNAEVHSLAIDQVNLLLKILEAPAEGLLSIVHAIRIELHRAFVTLNNLTSLELARPS